MQSFRVDFVAWGQDIYAQDLESQNKLRAQEKAVVASSPENNAQERGCLRSSSVQPTQAATRSLLSEAGEKAAKENTKQALDFDSGCI